MSKCFGFLRRSFVVVVTCVITVVSMAVSISPPVSAVGVFSPFNFYQLYQMLHGLLLGDGGGNSQTFGEWLEENMTRTVGSGNEKKEFLITPGMKLSDMMTQASLNLVLGAALSDGGIAGTSKIKDLIDSWTEVYDTSDIGEIGDSAGNDFVYDGLETYNGLFRFSRPLQFISKSYPNMKNGMFFNPSSATPYVVLVPVADSSLSPPYRVYQIAYFSSSKKWDDTLFSLSYMHLGTSGSAWTYVTFHPSLWEKPQQFSNGQYCWSMSDAQNFLNVIGIDGSVVYDSVDQAVDLLNSGSLDWQPGKTGTDGFVGPVYAMPAAKQLITDTGTLSGLRLDVQTEDGTPDISAALDHAGVDNVNDLVAGVAAGTIPMSQVYDDMRVVPYVLTDVDTGEIVTDLNVSATDAKTKAVALDKDLSIPKDISAVDAYQITGKTWDPSLSKYKLPLFDFFPFCLPYDAYQFLTMLDVTPVAPVFQVDTTPLFSHTRFFHAADGYKITLDLTKYEEVFQILRAGECLAIVVGLCLISYKLIHGGD